MVRLPHLNWKNGVCVNNKIKVVKRNEYGFRDERCFNLRHYMHSVTVASLEMSDEPYFLRYAMLTLIDSVTVTLYKNYLMVLNTI